MLSLSKSVAAAIILSSIALTTRQPFEPIATYDLTIRPYATYGACSVGASPTYAVVGIAWGGKSPISGGYDHLCRGFTLTSLRTGARKTIVLLPAAQRKGLWSVDEPVLVGHWLAYQRYVALAGGNWEINVVNLRTGDVRRLDHWHGEGIVDIGPVITKWDDALTWVSGVRDVRGRVVYQIHTYDAGSAAGQIVATSSPGTRFFDAYRSGQVISFLAQTGQRSEVWVEDIRTHHVRQLTHSGQVGEAVITGPWVAWKTPGPDSFGAVAVENLRTARKWIATREPSYQLSAGDGLLGWYSPRRDQWTILDLVTGRNWRPDPIAAQQQRATMAHVQGDVVVENALGASGLLGRVQVYRNRGLPIVGKL
jgi:hypothetical protein